MASGAPQLLYARLPFRLSALTELSVVGPSDPAAAEAADNDVPASAAYASLLAPGRPWGPERLAARVRMLLAATGGAGSKQQQQAALARAAVLPSGLHLLKDAEMNFFFRTTRPKCQLVCSRADAPRLAAALRVTLGSDHEVLFETSSSAGAGIASRGEGPSCDEGPPAAVLRPAFACLVRQALSARWVPLGPNELHLGDGFLRAAPGSMHTGVTVAFDTSPEPDSAAAVAGGDRLLIRASGAGLRLRAFAGPEALLGDAAHAEGGLPEPLLAAYRRGEWIDLAASGRLWRLSGAQLSSLSVYPLPDLEPATITAFGLMPPGGAPAAAAIASYWKARHGLTLPARGPYLRVARGLSEEGPPAADGVYPAAVVFGSEPTTAAAHVQRGDGPAAALAAFVRELAEVNLFGLGCLTWEGDSACEGAVPREAAAAAMHMPQHLGPSLPVMATPAPSRPAKTPSAPITGFMAAGGMPMPPPQRPALATPTPMRAPLTTLMPTVTSQTPAKRAAEEADLAPASAAKRPILGGGIAPRIVPTFGQRPAGSGPIGLPAIGLPRPPPITIARGPAGSLGVGPTGTAIKARPPAAPSKAAPVAAAMSGASAITAAAPKPVKPSAAAAAAEEPPEQLIARVAAAAAAGTLGKVTVPSLKRFLALAKLPVARGGKKEELQARAAAHLAAGSGGPA